MLRLREYIQEAVSHGRKHQYSGDRLAAGDMEKYKDFEEALSISTYHTFLNNPDYLNCMDRKKPGGVPTHVDMTGYWMCRYSSKVTGFPRIWLFIDKWAYILLDFNEYGYLVDIGLYRSSSGKKISHAGDREKLLDLIAVL